MERNEIEWMKEMRWNGINEIWNAKMYNISSSQDSAMSGGLFHSSQARRCSAVRSGISGSMAIVAQRFPCISHI